MSLSIGEKDELKKARKKKLGTLKSNIKKECLAIAFVMISNGETRKADEAIRVYKRLIEDDTK